jgi:hypothetical protein
MKLAGIQNAAQVPASEGNGRPAVEAHALKALAAIRAEGSIGTKTDRRDRSDSADRAARTWRRGRKLPDPSAGDHPRGAQWWLP